MRAVIACVALVLAGCATPAPSGVPTGRRLPQAAEQCAAQPDLDWCHARR